MANIKNIQEAQVGDTLHHRNVVVEPLPGLKPCKPMVGNRAGTSTRVPEVWVG